MKIITTGFSNTMTKPQRITGVLYLAAHILLLPILLGLLAYFNPGILDLAMSNMLYYGIGFVFCITVMFGYLRKAFDIMLDNKGRVITSIASSYLMYWVMSTLLGAVLMYTIGEEALSNPNDAALVELAEMAGMGTMTGIAVFLAPIVEETLFRGVLFGLIRGKSRFWAYAVSIAVFGAYHVWQYSVFGVNWMLLVYAIQYIPAGFAMARCYEQSGCIWAPIFLHTLNNILAVLAI